MNKTFSEKYRKIMGFNSPTLNKTLTLESSIKDSQKSSVNQRPFMSDFKKNSSYLIANNENRSIKKTIDFVGYSTRKDFIDGYASPVDARFESLNTICPDSLSKHKRTQALKIGGFTPHVAFTDVIAKLTNYMAPKTRSTRAMMASNPEPTENDAKKYGSLPKFAPPIADLYQRGDGYKVIVKRTESVDENLFKNKILKDIRDLKFKKVEEK